MKRFFLPTLSMLLSLVLIGSRNSNSEAATYDITQIMQITTFADPATNGGVNIGVLSPSDLISLQGGTLTLTGAGDPYSALIGSGTEASTGFDWGTGGTFNIGSEVDLSINTSTSTSAVNIVNSGPGSLNLTSADPVYLNINTSAGSIQTSSNLITSQPLILSPSTTGPDPSIKVNGNLTAQNGSKINAGSITVLGEYINNGTQTDVNGSLTAETATFNSGGLYVYEGGSFKISGEANFAVQSAIINYGDITVGDQSQFDATTVADIGTMTIGDGAIFTGLFSNSGTVDILGSVTLFHVLNMDEMNINGDAIVTGDFDNYGGVFTIDGDGTFNNTAIIENNSVLDIKENATFTNSLSVSNGSLLVGGNINANGITTTGNSVLGLSNKLAGSDLGDLISTDTINLSPGTTIQTDLSQLISIKGPTLLIHIVSDESTDQFQIDGTATDTETVAALIGSNTALRTIYAVDTGTGYDIYANAQTLGDYAENTGLQKPAIDAGTSVDNMIEKIDPSNPAYEMADNLYNETDQEVINQTLYNLATGYGVENLFAMTLTHLGQAGSPYFFGNTSGNSHSQNPCEWPDQKEIRFASYYESMSTGGNFFQHGFNLHRTGMIVDLCRCLSSQMSGGILFSYSAPRLRQSGELAGYGDQFHTRLNLEKYELAAHAEYSFENGMRLSAFVGGGSWNMDLNRRAFGSSEEDLVMDRTFEGNTDGNTLSGSVYLNMPIQKIDFWTITPVIGIDTEHSWLYGFDETSTGIGNWQEMNNISQGNFYSPVQYGRTYYDRTMARAGISCHYEKERTGVVFNLFYGTQLGGEDYATVPVNTLGGVYEGTIQGLGIGRETLNIGGGIRYDLNTLRTASLSANYNYYTLANAQASNITAALRWIW